MNNLIINSVDIELFNQKVRIYISENKSRFSIKKKLAIIEDKINYSLNKQVEVVYLSLNNISDSYIEVDFTPSDYFFKLILELSLKEYLFNSIDFSIVDKNFIGGVDVYVKSKKQNLQSITEFLKFSINFLNKKSNNTYEIQIVYDSKVLILNTSITKANLKTPVFKVFSDRCFYKYDSDLNNTDKFFPVLSKENLSELNISDNDLNINSYKLYFDNINWFYNNYLSKKNINNLCKFSSENFNSLAASDISKVSKVENNLEFANGFKDVNIFNGIRKHGPFDSNIKKHAKFIFIYDPSIPKFKDAANALYNSLKKGLGTSFPGLEQFIKIPFDIDINNSFKITNSNILADIKSEIKKHFIPDNQFQYFAFIISPFSKTDNDKYPESYYAIKHLLLQNNILSQFIYYNNISKSNFNYHLPNIAVAVLAKLGGMPWKLDTLSSDTIILGFNVFKKRDTDSFIGNTVVFNSNGVFLKFYNHKGNTPDDIVKAFQESISGLINHINNVGISKIVIHYYKTMKKADSEKIESTLNKLDISLPFIVLTINDSKSRDYVVFDTDFSGVMPISGTIAKIKSDTYLLSNNTRYNVNSMQQIKKYPFPIKIKFNPFGSYDSFFSRTTLIEQVYAFSRVYWKSINQISNPVTLEYSSIISEMIKYFPDNSIPETDLTHNNPWFL